MTKFLLCVIVFCISIIITFARINAGSEKMGFSSKNPPETAWQLLSHKKIYFGHQSVGNNIIDGIKDIMKENSKIKLNIVKTNDPKMFTTPIFAHSPIGKNMNPISKIDAFAKFMEQGIGNKADFAFFKFCYVDITRNTDINQIFTYYKNTMKHLKEKYPKTTFIHVTVPLTIVQTGFKVWIKKIIGRPIGGYADNIKRNQFNEMLRNEYKNKEPIFDLALTESTFPDKTRCFFTKEGKTYYSLVPAYTHDGGHLNELGRKIVAEQLLILLANLSQ